VNEIYREPLKRFAPNSHGSIGADPVEDRGTGPHKNLVVGSYGTDTHESFTEISVTSAKIDTMQGASLQ